MNLIPHRLLSALVLVGGLAASLTSQADAISAVQLLREGGCGGTFPPARLLRHVASLDRAAEQWASGRTVAAAAQLSGYDAQSTTGLHIRGPGSAALQLLKQAGCRTVVDPAFHDLGVFTRGLDTWLLFGAVYVAPASARAAPAGAPTAPAITRVAPGARAAPASAQGPTTANRALQLVNEARAHGAHCGERSFGPAPPVRLSDTLAWVAYGHAHDMAKHNYFEHEDRTGHSPADRVRAVGYQEKLVGENIAYGPKSADEVVQGWLDSPAHCENIMDPRFGEMGIAYAPGQSSRRGRFWVQLLVAPKA
ncbi:MAG TPA: CAP domain-containing protein [Steroidobacteraceae bacterium]|nr:CAP domain-containing protein [Steroidobacteraceae bacterium]